MHPQIMSEELFVSDRLRRHAYYADETAIVFNMDVRQALTELSDAEVKANCIVTSPPFYGQRDYEFEDQIGLEVHPSQYIDRLAEVFDRAGDVLAGNGSLWINIGDTYWSGKGEHRSSESKQSARRFGIGRRIKRGTASGAYQSNYCCFHIVLPLRCKTKDGCCETITSGSSQIRYLIRSETAVPCRMSTYSTS